MATVEELTQQFQHLCVQIGHARTVEGKLHREMDKNAKLLERLVDQAIDIDDAIPAAREGQGE